MKIIVDTPTEFDLKNYYNYCAETIELQIQLEGGYIVLAERLKYIRDRRLWEGSFEGFKEFLREMRISVPTASRMIAVYEKFVVMGGIPKEEVGKVGWSNVAIFTPLIFTKEKAIEIWDKVHLLDRPDAQKTYAEMKSGVEMSACQHEDTYTMKVCRKCGDKWNLYEEEKAH